MAFDSGETTTVVSTDLIEGLKQSFQPSAVHAVSIAKNGDTFGAEPNMSGSFFARASGLDLTEVAPAPANVGTVDAGLEYGGGATVFKI